jgi:hypothetical protein
MGFSIDFQGMDDLKIRLAMKDLPKDLIRGMGTALNQVHNQLKFDIKKRYTFDKSLDNVRMGGAINDLKQGTNLISGGLQYEYKPTDLSKFSYTYQHIPSSNTGAVHTVTVIRGSPKQVVGNGNGGFVPRNRKENTKVYYSSKGRNNTLRGTPNWVSRYGAQMFERVGNGRKHLRLLTAPSLSQMASYCFSHPSTELTTVINNLSDTLSKEINL